MNKVKIIKIGTPYLQMAEQVGTSHNGNHFLQRALVNARIQLWKVDRSLAEEIG